MLAGSLWSRDQRKIFVTKQSNSMVGSRGKPGGCSFLHNPNTHYALNQLIPNQN